MSPADEPPPVDRAAPPPASDAAAARNGGGPRVPLGRWSLPVKAMLLCVPVFLTIGALQLALLARGAEREVPAASALVRAQPDATARLRARAALALAGPYLLAILCCGYATYRIVRHRTTRLTRALERIGQGDLRGEMPPSIDTDLVVVREALDSMRSKLDALTSRLQHTDAQRRRLFADLAHELATPTSSILAISESLQSHGGRIERADARLVAALEHEATRLERLVRDVRDLAALDDPDVALEPAPTDLARLAQHVVDRLNVAADETAARARCELADAAAAGGAWAEVDAVRIDQVITNLLTNAQRYTPRDGQIVVRVGADAVAPGARGVVRLAVEDSGRGVPDELLPRLGERLLRLDPSRSTKTGGHGLGLSIVSAVVARHGGALRFERASLGGLRAVIELPARR